MAKGLTDKQQEQRWEAEGDLEAIKRVEDIRKNKGRAARAKAEAKRALADLKVKQAALQKVAGKKPVKKKRAK